MGQSRSEFLKAEEHDEEELEGDGGELHPADFDDEDEDEEDLVD